MKNIVTRSLSGIVYVALIVGCLWWGPLPTAILFALFGVLAVVELHKIMLGTPRTGIALAAMALDGFIVALMAFMPWMFEASVEALLASLCVLFLYPLFRFILALYDKGDSAFADSAASLMAPFYIGLPMLSVSFLRSGLHHGLFMVLAMFVLIWLNDTGAYCVGSTLGRNRMFTGFRLKNRGRASPAVLSSAWWPRCWPGTSIPAEWERRNGLSSVCLSAFFPRSATSLSRFSNATTTSRTRAISSRVTAASWTVSTPCFS